MAWGGGLGPAGQPPYSGRSTNSDGGLRPPARAAPPARPAETKVLLPRASSGCPRASAACHGGPLLRPGEEAARLPPRPPAARRAFLAKARRAADRICGFLRERCFQEAPWGRTRVRRVVEGGSLGKGTTMKKGSDVDLVLFLDIIRSYADQERDRKRITELIKSRLTECQEELNLEVSFEKSKWSNPRVLQFRLRSNESEDYIDFDVLPAFDALGQYDRSRPDSQIFAGLICTGQYGQFSPCFTELQRQFIVGRPTKLKNLICLVKYWYKELPEQKSLPPKYALELLTVYSWEQGSGQENFSTAEGFRTVLWLIERHQQICIYWTNYYDVENEDVKQCLHAQLSKKRPVVLDPADPTANIGEGKRWDLLAKEATYSASLRCCQNPDGSLVKPWVVPLEVPWKREWSYCTLM